MRVGDTLVFSASAGPEAGATAWRLVSYPRNLIVLVSRSPIPPFRFRALDQGTGSLRLTLGEMCGGPGPPAASGRDCPAADSPSGGGPFVPVRSLTFPIKVLPRGE